MEIIIYNKDPNINPEIFKVHYIRKHWKTQNLMYQSDNPNLPSILYESLVYECHRYHGRRLENPESILEFAYDSGPSHPKRWPKAEKYIMKDPDCAVAYAEFFIHNRWKKAEPYILQSPECAYEYAIGVLQKRWPEAEPLIIKSDYAFSYAKRIIGGRWIEAESAMINRPYSALHYAVYVLKHRFLAAEENMKEDGYVWNRYCDVFPEART